MSYHMKLIAVLTPVKERDRQTGCHVDKQNRNGEDCSNKRKGCCGAVNQASPKHYNDTQDHHQDNCKTRGAIAIRLSQRSRKRLDPTHSVERTCPCIDASICIAQGAIQNG